MITTAKWIEMAYVTFVPLAILLVNALDFALRSKSRRGKFLCLEQRSPKNYFAVHWLLIVGFVLLAVSWLWEPASQAMHLTMATWFMWINVHAMITRRRGKPTST